MNVEDNEMKMERGKPKCPACGWANIRFRIRANEFFCVRCGHTWPKPETDKQEPPEK